MLWTVNWSANGAGWTNNNYVTIFSGTVTITDGNGNTLQTKSMSGQIAYARKDVQLVSGSFSVGVNTYGDRNIAFSAVFRIGVNGASGESTGSQTFALDNIPLASTISSVTSNVSVGSSGGVATVNIARNNASYTHRVVWAFGSNSYTQTGQGTSASYTIPASWLATIPNSASGSASVTVTTYNGSTQIGQSASATFTITAAVNPTVGSFTVAPRGTAYTAGITTAYIAGYSTALLSASSAAGVNGSSIAKYEFINGSTVIASYNSSASSYTHTTGTLTGSSATFSVRVTDTRGRTATKAASAITIKAYATPSFSSANAYRSNSSGTAQNDGTYIRVTANAVATPSENSITALTYATKATNSGSYSAEANVGSGVTASGFANTTSYDVRITATDKLGNKSYKYYTIPTAEYTMDFKVGGKGVAFGKVAETDDLVESEWDIKSLGNISAKGYSAEYSAPANLSDINNTIITKINAMSNGTVAYLTLNPSASISPFGGGRELIRVYRASTGYGTAEMSCYHSTAGERRFIASIYNGAVTAWRQDNGSRMLNFTASSAKALYIPNNYRGILYITDSTGGNCGEYFLIAGSSGATGYTAVKAASNVTLTNGTNTFTITPASGTRYCLLIDVNGYATE